MDCLPTPPTPAAVEVRRLSRDCLNCLQGDRRLQHVVRAVRVVQHRGPVWWNALLKWLHVNKLTLACLLRNDVVVILLLVQAVTDPNTKEVDLHVAAAAVAPRPSPA